MDSSNSNVSVMKKTFPCLWLLHFLIDSAIIVGAYLLAFVLRFGFTTPRFGWSNVIEGSLSLLLLQWSFLLICRCPQTMWRFCSGRDIPRFMVAVGSTVFTQLVLRFIWGDSDTFLWLRPPLGVTVMTGTFILMGLLGVRLAWRWFCEASFQGGPRERILILGAGQLGSRIVQDFLGNGIARAVGFLDDDPAKLGKRIQTLPILGTHQDLAKIVEQTQASELVIAIAQPTPGLLQSVATVAASLKLTLRIAPPVSTWHGPRALRKIDVADLLGRREAETDLAKVVALLSGQCVMITGAGGSIGSEIVRQVFAAKPKTLVIIDQSENALYEINRELRTGGVTDVDVRAVIADCGNVQRMRDLLKTFSPTILLHAAAYKHVPMMEANPVEAVRNNTWMTYQLGKLAIEASVKRFVFISTDKAVRPVSVMGMTKRLAEILLQGLNAQHATRFSMVRFGNVLDSSGSVVPLFREQIAKGGPVTVTDPEMRRYFMTISEAVSLVLQSATFAEGGEIFVLDMGKDMRIVELAETMITLSGLRPYIDIPINFTGIRPGEKLFEELDISENSTFRTGHARIFKGKIEPPTAEHLAAIIQCCEQLQQQPTLSADIVSSALKPLLG